jgi:hypothetical protein
MTLRHCFIAAATTLLCGLSVPAHASCFGLLDERCKLSVAKEDDLSFGSMVVTGSGEATLDPISGALSGSAMTPALFFKQHETGQVHGHLQCESRCEGQVWELLLSGERVGSPWLE